MNGKSTFAHCIHIYIYINIYMDICEYPTTQLSVRACWTYRSNRHSSNNPKHRSTLQHHILLGASNNINNNITVTTTVIKVSPQPSHRFHVQDPMHRECWVHVTNLHCRMEMLTCREMLNWVHACYILPSQRHTNIDILDVENCKSKQLLPRCRNPASLREQRTATACLQTPCSRLHTPSVPTAGGKIC